MKFWHSRYKFYRIVCWIIDHCFTFYHIMRDLLFPRLSEGHQLQSISEYRSIVIRYDLLEFFRGNNSTYGFGAVESFFRVILKQWIFRRFYKHIF